MKSMRGKLRDPWFLLSIVLALGLVLLVVVPQYRIFVASTEQALGKVVFRRGSSGALENVPTSTTGFELASEEMGLAISRSGQSLLEVQPLTDKQVVITPSTGGDISA